MEDEKNKKYLSKIKCFHYHEFGHYATKCPNQKESRKDHVASLTKEDTFLPSSRKISH